MRIAVAGNDIAGLTLALRLRLKGHDVTVHDSDTTSPVPEFFTVIAPYRDLFLKCGDPLDDVIGIVPVTTPLRCGAVALPPSGAQAPAIAATFGDDAAREWTAFLQTSANVWSQIRVESFVPRRTLVRQLRRSLATPALRDVATACVPTSDPQLLSEAATVFPYLMQTFGMWAFDGGLPAFEQALRARCSDHEVQFARSEVPREARSVDNHFSETFGAPRRWLRPPERVRTQQLGLAFVGMAAESIAERIGRA